jgi:putative aldouronate transport system permease protein
MYISARKLWPLTLVLREIVMEDNSPALAKAAAALDRSHPHTLRMAAIVITILPIMIVYPFMQKNFVKGIMLGSVKG